MAKFDLSVNKMKSYYTDSFGNHITIVDSEDSTYIPGGATLNLLDYDDDVKKIAEYYTYYGWRFLDYKLDTDWNSPYDTLNMYYVTDESQTKEVSYIVEYYKNGKKVSSDTQVEKSTIQVLQTEIEVDKTNINLTDKYEGYKLDSEATGTIPEKVQDGEVIKVYYVLEKNNMSNEENNAKTLTSENINVNNPMTGDDIILWDTLFIVSLILMILVCCIKRKRIAKFFCK